MADRFTEGECYFTVNYLDSILSVPYVRTLVFVRRSAFGPEGAAGKHWFFKDVDSYVSAREELFAFDASSLHAVMRVGGLLRELRGYATRCEARKKNAAAGKEALLPKKRTLDP